MDYLQSNWCDKMMLKTKINILLSILTNYNNIFLFGTKLDCFYEFQLFNIISEGQTKYILIHCLTWFISSFYLRQLYKVGFAYRISSNEIPSPSNCKKNTRSNTTLIWNLCINANAIILPQKVIDFCNWINTTPFQMHKSITFCSRIIAVY